MEEGTLVAWHVAEGAEVAAGEQILEIETAKIANAVEATHAGILRRRLAMAGQSYPCGALLGVIADANVPDEQIAAFVAERAQAKRQVGAQSNTPVPQMLAVRGRQIRFLHQGAGGGLPVLLIHGFAGDLNNWLFVQPSLSEKRSTYAVDLPGHGGSSKDLNDINSLNDVAELLVAFLDQLGIEKVHLVAHSLGGAVALALARKYDKRVASLVLLSPAGLGISPVPEFIEGLIAARSRRDMTSVLKMLLAHEGQVSRDMVNDMLKFKRLDGAEPALRKFAGFLREENRSAAQALQDISAPVHVIWGAHDRVVPRGTNELPNGIRLSVLEGVGHMPHIERNSQVVELIETTLVQGPDAAGRQEGAPAA